MGGSGLRNRVRNYTEKMKRGNKIIEMEWGSRELKSRVKVKIVESSAKWEK